MLPGEGWCHRGSFIARLQSGWRWWLSLAELYFVSIPILLSPEKQSNAEVVMKCKTWCVDVQSNNVAEVYAEQIKDRVVRFGYEHPASAVSFQSFFDFVGHHQLLNPFKSKDHQSIMLMWTWSIPVQLKQHAEDFVVQLREFIQSIDEFGGEGAMEVKLTGNIILDHEMKVIWPRRCLFNMCLLPLYLALFCVLWIAPRRASSA